MARETIADLKKQMRELNKTSSKQSETIAHLLDERGNLSRELGEVKRKLEIAQGKSTNLACALEERVKELDEEKERAETFANERNKALSTAIIARQAFRSTFALLDQFTKEWDKDEELLRNIT